MKTLLAWLTLIVTTTFVVAPVLTPPFAGFRADQLPNPQIAPPIQPAGYAFAIWGLIYTWLAVSAVFGVIRRRDDARWNRVRVPLIASLALGTPWLAIANASAIWATLTIIAMAATAIAALLATPAADRGWLRWPLALYAGWLTAASFVALGATAAGYGIMTGPVGWAVVGIAGALCVAVAVLRRLPAAGYGGALVWALIGIVVANGMDNLAITTLALAGAAVVAVFTLWSGRQAHLA
ncbi:MAG: hypothetical protein GC146_05355 [Limimaricola sp.]|uniref:hypothetical protein n=1 Tax=Limimaricola sp. TaxID=2211665 RepID=UPI001DA87756|nr:hypothetical protein [Limimaricola sp.]MBI1416634.1 hypothetical protein [Limimaricola sp.]